MENKGPKSRSRSPEQAHLPDGFNVIGNSPDLQGTRGNNAVGQEASRGQRYAILSL